MRAFRGRLRAMNDATYGEFTVFAEGLAATSGEILRRYFRAPFEIDDKPDANPVTQADREAESRIRELIGAAYPEFRDFCEIAV